MRNTTIMCVHCSRGGRRNTTPKPVYLDDGRCGQYISGVDIPAAVPYGRHRLY